MLLHGGISTLGNVSMRNSEWIVSFIFVVKFIIYMHKTAGVNHKTFENDHLNQRYSACSYGLFRQSNLRKPSHLMFGSFCFSILSF